ncbi:MAG: hypothetical protein ABII80_02730 [bacterium]
MNKQEEQRTAFLKGIPLESYKVPYSDFPLGFADLQHDPSQPDYADTQYQLEYNFFRWTQQFCVEGPMREYVRYLIKSGVIILELTQTRQSRGTVLFSFELDRYRVVAYDPAKHEKQVPTIPTHKADYLLDKANAYRSLATYQHDKRTKPVYETFDDQLTERELKLLALRKLTPESLSSKIISEEIQSEIARIESLYPSIAPSNTPHPPSDDGVEF